MGGGSCTGLIPGYLQALIIVVFLFKLNFNPSLSLPFIRGGLG